DNGDAYVEGLSLSNLFKATDTDGDVVVIGAAVSIDIENDVPLEFTTPPTAAVGTNSTTPFSLLNISLNEPSVGADSPGTTTFDVVDGTAIFDATNNALTTNTGAALSWNVVSPSVIQGVTADNFVAFQIELNGDGTYDYLQYTQLATLSERDITNLSSVGGGNVPAKGIDVPGTPFDLLLSTRDGETVNTNATAIGVGAGQSMSGNDVIRVDFLQDVFVTGSGGGAVLNWGEYYAANSYRQDVSGLAGTQNADFVVRVVVADPIVAGVDADGDSIFYGDTNDDYVSPTLTTIEIYDAAGVLVVNPALQGILITQTTDGWQILNLPNLYDFKVTSETPFNAVEIESLLTSDTFKLGQIKLAAFAAQDVTFNAPIDYTDTDGDSVDSMITVDLSAPPPVVLDLDGDGQIAFLSQEAGVAFDYEGDGILEQTAWVGSSDGLLVRDANGDGIVNDGREIVFGTGGQTDLEGLAARHDSNGDGQLTEADAEYASFGVWQDANTNGVSEPGELRSLSELGIVSIDLTGTGQPYLAADGDVLVSGESSFTRSDGSTGLVADVSFTTSARQVQEAQKAETVSGQSLTNALVAASLVASIGAVVGGDEAGAGQALSQEQPVAASNGVDSPAAAPLAVGPENSSSLLSSPAFEAKAPEAMSMRADPVADPAQAALDGRPAGGEQLPAPSDLLADTILTLPQPIMPGAPSVDGSAAIFMVGGADAAAGLVPSAALGAVLADALPPEATGPDIEALLDVLGAAPNESRLPDGLAPAGGGQGGTAGDLTFFTADAGFAIQQFLESAMASQEVAAAAQS
ncbi:MAG TPA: hypothetical protein VFO69_08995, partial [Allosphingosinicella sp.]|nr:hypothetical protein [Allosphingosinicella sp.]